MTDDTASLARATVVVLPCYRSADNIERFLPALLRERERLGFRLIVVDDASPDDSVARVRAAFPDVELIERPTNGGFGAACNTGVEAAEGARFVYLVNADVEVLEGFLEPLLAHFDDPELFGVSSVAVDDDGTVWDGLRRGRWKRGKIRFRKTHAAEAPPLEAAAPTLYPCGGHCLLDRARFLELGGFDLLFAPYYWEDADLGYRGWKRGWTCLVEPASRVAHRREHSDIDKHEGIDRAALVIHRNRYLFIWKNIHDARLLWGRHLLPLVPRLASSWLVGDFRYYRTFWMALEQLPAALRARRRARAEARCGDRELAHLFEDHEPRAGD